MSKIINGLVAVYITTTLLLFSGSAMATLTNEDAIGTFSGTQSITLFSCVTPSENGTFTGNWSVTNSNLNGNNFDFDGVVDNVFGGGVSTFTGSAMITGVGTSSGSGDLVDNTGAVFGNFTQNATLSADANTLTSTASGGFLTAGGGCFFTNNVTATRVGGSVIAPTIAPSSAVTEAVLFNTQIQTTVAGISSHITGALNGILGAGGPRVTDNQFTIEGATGLNAGDGFAVPYGVWGNYSYTDYENDLSSTAFDGTSHTFLGGIDFSFWENTVLGVAFGYDNGDLDTTFNGGHQDTDSFTVAPYFGALLSDTLSLDFNVGYSNVDYDQFRTLAGSTTAITSSPNADRWFGALNLNGVTYHGNWILGGRVGALYAKSVTGSFTESNGTVVAESRTRVSTGSIAGDVAYSYQKFEPFVNLSYQYDFQLTEVTVTTGAQPSNDRDDILMTAGVRYYDNNGISGNLEYSKRFDRDDFDEDRISITVRADF